MIQKTMSDVDVKFLKISKYNAFANACHDYTKKNRQTDSD